MKRWQFATALVLAMICLVLAVSVVCLAATNSALQYRLQIQQAQLNNGLLGQRGQQVTSLVVQEMVNASPRSSQIRAILIKYGYNVPASAADRDEDSDGAKKASDKKSETTPKEERTTP
jgi:hypothetical protein